MTFEEFQIFAEDKMATDWTTTPIQFENRTDSVALVTAKNAKNPWVRFTILDGDGQRQSIGSNSPIHRYAGVMIAQIFVKQTIGTKLINQYADSISAIWKDYSGQPDVEVRTPSVEKIGDDKGWFQKNVNIPFQNDETS